MEKDIEKRMNMSEVLNHYWIKGGRLLLDEQEKVYNAGVFLSYLLTNHISSFDAYINKSQWGLILDNKELDKVHGLRGCPPGRCSVIQFGCLALISGLIIKYVSVFSILIYMS